MVTLSIRNSTFLTWTVTLQGSKTTDARASSLDFAPLIVAPNDDSSCTLVRLISNESLRIDRIEVAATVDSRATLTMHDGSRREHAWRHLSVGGADISLRVQWGPSDAMPGHVAPTLSVETIQLDGG